MLINKPQIGSKTFNYSDVKKGMESLYHYGLDVNWYGGRVDQFGISDEGFRLCLEGDQVIGIYIPLLDKISPDGIKMLADAGVIESANNDQIALEDAPIVKTYKCENCGEEFEKAIQLAQHKRKCKD